MTTQATTTPLAGTASGQAFDTNTFKVLGGLGLLVGLTIPLAGYFIFQGAVAPLDDMADRLAFGLRWMVFPALAVVVGFQAAGLARFTSPQANGAAPPEGSTLNMHRRYLQNTLEQFSYFFVTQMALVTLLPATALHLTPIFALQFLLGRLLFWRGYLKTPAWRSFGLPMNHPNMFVLLYVIFRLVAGA